MPISIDTTRDANGDQSPNVLTFRNGRRLRVLLFEVNFLGQLPRHRGPPFLVLGGRECVDCDAPTNLWLVPADADTATRGAFSYYYPGSVRGEESPEPFYKGRAFIGRCLDDQRPAVVWFQSERDSLGAWHSGVYRLGIDADTSRGEFLNPRPQIAATLMAVRHGVCYEIPSIDNFEG